MQIMNDCFAMSEKKGKPFCLILRNPGIKAFPEATTYCKIEKCKFYKPKGEVDEVAIKLLGMSEESSRMP